MVIAVVPWCAAWREFRTFSLRLVGISRRLLTSMQPLSSTRVAPLIFQNCFMESSISPIFLGKPDLISSRSLLASGQFPIAAATSLVVTGSGRVTCSAKMAEIRAWGSSARPTGRLDRASGVLFSLPGVCITW